jgi:hypothetical protein
VTGVNPVVGWYVPLPNAVAKPTTSHPAPHEVGALAAGPNTLNVIVPLGEDPPDSVAEIDDAEISLPSLPDDGALSDNDVGTAVTVVLVIPGPQGESEPMLFASPL